LHDIVHILVQYFISKKKIEEQYNIVSGNTSNEKQPSIDVLNKFVLHKIIMYVYLVLHNNIWIKKKFYFICFLLENCVCLER